MNFYGRILMAIALETVCASASHSMDELWVPPKSRLNNYCVFLASRHFDSFEDFINLTHVAKRFRENTDRFFYNPIKLNERQLSVFSSLRTYHIYDKDDEILENNKIMFYEVWPSIGYTEALKCFNAVFYFRNERDEWRKQYYDKKAGKIVENCLCAREHFLTLDEETRRKLREAESVFDDSQCKKSPLSQFYDSVERFRSNIDSGDLRINGKPTTWRGSLKIDASFPCIRKDRGKWEFVNCRQFAEIDDKAFENNVEIKEIIIPKSIKRLGEASFKGCTNLISATLPDSLEVIDNDAFSGCSNFELEVPPFLRRLGDRSLEDTAAATQERDAPLKINVPQSLKSLGAIFGNNDGYTVNADILIDDDHEFEYLCGIKFKKPITMKKIREDMPFLEKALVLAEYNNEANKIMIPEYVKTITGVCFYDDLDVERLVVHKDVESIINLSFLGHSNISEICYYPYQVDDDFVQKFRTELTNDCQKDCRITEEGKDNGMIKLELFSTEDSMDSSEDSF